MARSAGNDGQSRSWAQPGRGNCRSCLSSSSCSCSSSPSSSCSSTSGGSRAAGRRPSLAAPTLLSLSLLLLGVPSHLRGAHGFGYGEPIDVVVTAGDSLALAFEGPLAAAAAVSFQQCAGDVFLEMDVLFNGTSVSTPTSTTSKCVRLRGSSALLDDPAVLHDNLCVFQNSGPVGQGYLEEDQPLAGQFVDPNLVTAEFVNTGSVTASAQVVMFSTEFPAPSADQAIDRVVATTFREGNIFTVEAQFQADGAEDQNFCSGSNGCSIAAYYLEVNNAADADRVFGTVCQARDGVKLYEGFTGPGSTFNDDNAATAAAGVDQTTTSAELDDDQQLPPAGGGSRALSTTSFDLTACVEFPKLTAGRYRMFIVVSPDTASFAQVGYGVQDQLMYASGIIEIPANADLTCPDPSAADTPTSGALAAVYALTPVRASGAMAAGLAAAAASRRAVVAGF